MENHDPPTMFGSNGTETLEFTDGVTANKRMDVEVDGSSFQIQSTHRNSLDDTSTINRTTIQNIQPKQPNRFSG